MLRAGIRVQISWWMPIGANESNREELNKIYVLNADCIMVSVKDKYIRGGGKRNEYRLCIARRMWEFLPTVDT